MGQEGSFRSFDGSGWGVHLGGVCGMLSRTFGRIGRFGRLSRRHCLTRGEMLSKTNGPQERPGRVICGSSRAIGG